MAWHYSNRRVQTKRHLTNYTNEFHSHMSWERSAPDFMKQGNPRWGSRHYLFNKFMSTSFREKTPPEELQPYLIDVLENYTSDDTQEIEFHLRKRDKINPSLNSSSRPRVDHRPIPLMTPRPLVLVKNSPFLFFSHFCNESNYITRLSSFLTTFDVLPLIHLITTLCYGWVPHFKTT